MSPNIDSNSIFYFMKVYTFHKNTRVKEERAKMIHGITFNRGKKHLLCLNRCKKNTVPKIKQNTGYK